MLTGTVTKHNGVVRFKTDTESYTVTNDKIDVNITIETHDYNIYKKTIHINSYEMLEKVKRNKSNRAIVEYGADFETWVKYPDGTRKLIIRTTSELPENIYNLQPEVLLGVFVSKDKKLLYDATRQPETALKDIMLNKETKRLRFFNLGYDGAYIIALLTKWGFTHTTDKLDINQFTTIVSPMGKIYGISYKYTNGKKTYQTDIYDTANIFVGQSLDKALKSFKVTGFDGRELRKLDSDDFAAELWFDNSGKVIQKQIDYAFNDAEGAIRLYDVFADIVKKNYNEKNIRKVYTIGSAAWTDMQKNCFPTSKKQGERFMRAMGYSEDDYMKPELAHFKMKVGNWSLDYDRHFRKHLYRGGYNLLNDRYYNQVIDSLTWHADIVSAYPDLLKNGKLCGKLKHVYDTDVERKDNMMYIYDILIHKTKLKKGWWPVLSNGRKTDLASTDGTNYITDYDKDEAIQISVFDVELDKCFEAYDVFDYEVLAVYECEILDGKVFAPFVNFWMTIKDNAPKDSPEREFAKLMLNSLTGKIGENPEHDLIGWLTDKNGVVRTYIMDESADVGHTRSVPLIASITAYLRMKLYESMQAVGFENVLLAATDCILVKDLTEEQMKSKLHVKKELGAYELEPMTKLLLLGEKAYQYIDGDSGRTITKCNGMKKDVASKLAFGELTPGLKTMALEKRKLDGGVLLIPKYKLLKARQLSFMV